MAKDGTMRGGPRVGQTGRPKKALIEKVETNNPGGRKLEVLNIPDNLEGTDFEGNDMPPVKEYLSAQQRDGSSLEAAEIFKSTWLWLKKIGCERFVNKQLIEQYSMSVARWIQCEEAISSFGFLAKHPTTGAIFFCSKNCIADKWNLHFNCCSYTISIFYFVIICINFFGILTSC